MLPRRTHAEARGTTVFRTACFAEHLLHFQQLFLFQFSVVVAALRAVLAVFGTRTGLDRQQGADLHRIWIEMLAMGALRVEQEVVERQLEQGFDFVVLPVVAQGGCHIGSLKAHKAHK